MTEAGNFTENVMIKARGDSEFEVKYQCLQVNSFFYFFTFEFASPVNEREVGRT